MYDTYESIDDSEFIEHYGTKRHSGRFPWGSGKEPYQHSGDFLSRVETLRKEGCTYTDPKTGKVYKGDTAIAKTVGLSTTEFRVQMSLANDERRSMLVDQAKSLREHGKSLNEIASIMGFKNDSSVRSLLNESSASRMEQSKKTAEFLKSRVDADGMIDVGANANLYLGVSAEKMKEAIYLLQREGYVVYKCNMPQITNPGNYTRLKVLCPPDTPYSAVYDFGNIHTLDKYTSHDGGKTFDDFKYPSSLNPKKLGIRYAEDGGIGKDGLIELRRGVPGLDLDGSRYAQIRMLVGKDRYLKGMAVMSDDLPDGVDVVFNTNKKRGTDPRKVLKEIKDNPDNPFGALITAKGQHYYTDPETGKRTLSPINKTRSEGDWSDWSNTLPSQFLAKQSQKLIKQQLGLTFKDKQDEFNKICALNNPVVKKNLLESFANDCDSAAVHLQARALPGQKWHVIIPEPSLKDNEVYAPQYKNGEKVALVRFPHGGTFEIPVLTVNNRSEKCKKMIGSTPIDALCINSKVADRLSGADFDGDTVLAIPTGKKIKINSRNQLEGLVGFEPKDVYGADTIVKDPNTGKKRAYVNGREFKIMRNTQNEMGRVSNLITDMTVKGATPDELSRAVRHSMVVIDAEKHCLNYKQSEKDNGIKELKKKYQGHITPEGKYSEGASTILSQAKSNVDVLKRVGSPRVNIKGKPFYDPTKPEGALVYKTVDETYVDKKGKIQHRTTKTTRMEYYDDPHVLSTGQPQEEAYAEFASRMKHLGQKARIEMVTTPNREYSPSANKKYSSEVNSLNYKLEESLKNAPRERRAQAIANSKLSAVCKDNPELKDTVHKSELKKLRQQYITSARIQVGAQKPYIKITDQEWEAIQAGAISSNKLSQILNNAKMEDVRSLATPRITNSLTSSEIAKIKRMKDIGYSTSEIAESIGKSVSTINKYSKGSVE